MNWMRAPAVDCEPYRVLAEMYDHVMRHVDYAEWADYVEKVFDFYGSTPERIVEAACGTGTLALELTERGYRVTGYDLSESMIRRACEKAAERGSDAPTFEVRDMCDLPQDDADAVLCLYDSVNYCLNTNDVRTALRSFRRTVHEGALCIFDVTTETNSLRYFKNYRYRERWKDYTYRRRSEYAEKERLQINEFVIERERSSERVREVHEQRIYGLDELLGIIPTDRWRILGAFDDYSLDPADGDTERIHFVLRAR